MAKKANKATKALKKVESTKALSPVKEIEKKFEAMERRFKNFFRRPFSFLPSWITIPKTEEAKKKEKKVMIE